MNNLSIQNTLEKAYHVLGFSLDETKKALSELAALQLLAATSELANDMAEDEAAEFGEKIAHADDEERQSMVKSLIDKRNGNVVFQEKIKAAAKKVLDDYAAYLKTRGDDSQKAQIAQILAEIG
jgi:hypothetical protein